MMRHKMPSKAEIKKKTMVPLFLPFIFSVTLLFTMPSTKDETPATVNQPPKYTQKFSHWVPGSGTLKITNATLVENTFPEAAYSEIVTKPLEIQSVLPFIIYGDLGNDTRIPTSEEIKGFAKYNENQLILINDAYVTNEGVIIKDNNFYVGDCECHYKQCNYWRSKWFPSHIPYITVDQAVCITHEYGWFFDHGNVELLRRYFVVPEEILKESYVIVTSNTEQVKQGFRLLGVKRQQILCPEPDTAIFCKKLYTVVPLQCTHFQGYLLMNMRNKIAQKYGLDKNPPTEHILYNRENTEFRVISNFKDVRKEITKTFSQFTWKNVNIPSKLLEQFKLFNTFKIFVAVHGAAFANTLFMQPNTAVVELQVDRWVDNYLWISAYANVHHVITRDTSIRWRETGSKNSINVKAMVESTRLALEATGEIKKK